MISRTDDPLRDLEHYEAKREAQLSRLPKCRDCGEYIQQDDAVFLLGMWFCDSCVACSRIDTEGWND